MQGNTVSHGLPWHRRSGGNHSAEPGEPVCDRLPPGFTTPPPGFRARPARASVLTVPLAIIGGILLLWGGAFTVARIATDPAPLPSAEVRDAALAFRVTEIEPPVKSIGPATATGEYRVLTVLVRNTDDEPRSCAGCDQTLVDDRGREYPAAAIPGSAVPPGDTVTVKVAFDVPVGTVPAVLEVHGSQSSAGAKVDLR
ncbi:DUF4352 domain-containing protein [Nocardia sp. NPDC050697]|uniref:DUF4352 domain-containing protein n=1 Tax=Nocardia sp. NPDC050697 TaxID=3155158 RepID=UPI0033DA8C7C